MKVSPGGSKTREAARLRRSALHVLHHRLLELRQVQEDVRRLPQHGSRAAELAPWLLELRGVEQRAAAVALVAAGVLVAALGARAAYVAIGEKLLQRGGVELLRGLGGGAALGVDRVEDVLADFGLRPAGRARMSYGCGGVATLRGGLRARWSAMTMLR